MVIVCNPSTVTALKLQFKVRYKDNTGIARIAEIRSDDGVKELIIPIDSIQAIIVNDLNVGDGGRITISNETSISNDGAFTAHVTVLSL